MTGKDMIKILLISYGFHKNIEIEGWHTEDGSYFYDVHAENEEGESFHDIDYFMGTIRTINEFMDGLRHPNENLVYADGTKVKPQNTDMYFRFNDLSVKDLVDDKKRNEFYEKNKKADDEHDAYCEYMKPVWKEDENTRPCPDCKDNPKDIDFAHYKCSKGYYMRCDKLKQWMNDCRERDRKATEEWERNLAKTT